MVMIRNIFCLLLLLITALSSAQSAHPASPSDIPPATVRILTLDDRPPNLIFIKQLAAIAGIYPEISTGDDIAGQSLCLTEFDLVSLNAAIAGSLVGSRTADPWSLEPPVVNPDSLVHFAVPRAQPTVTDQVYFDEYREVIKQLDKPDIQKNVGAYIFDGVESTGNKYLDAYAYRIKGWLDFLERAALDPDRLLITLDDNRPGPLSDRLKLELGRYSHHVMDGTDEGMMLLFARYLREHQPSPPTTLGLVWTAPADLLAIMPFENSLVAENVLSELRWLKARVTSRLDMLDEWRPVLWIHGAGEGQGMKGESVSSVLQFLGNRRVVVADIAQVNRGDDELINAWRREGAPPGLVGYLGWNTACNTLGSAVALWMSIDYGYAVRSDPVSVQAATEIFLWSRILDDWFYQGIVRSEVRDAYAAQGANVWQLTSQESQDAAYEIAAKLIELWREEGIDLSIPLRIVQPLTETGFTVELPWNRFFEIELIPTDERGWVPQIISGE